MLVIVGSLLYFSIVPFIPYTVNFNQLLSLNIVALSLPAASALTVTEGKNFGMG